MHILIPTWRWVSALLPGAMARALVIPLKFPLKCLFALDAAGEGVRFDGVVSGDVGARGVVGGGVEIGELIVDDGGGR